MKLYKTSYLNIESQTTRHKWQGTQADARAARNELKADGQKAIETDEVDVPTSKPELLEWLNKNVTGE